jgi:hypothetical protein
MDQVWQGNLICTRECVRFGLTAGIPLTLAISCAKYGIEGVDFVQLENPDCNIQVPYEERLEVVEAAVRRYLSFAPGQGTTTVVYFYYDPETDTQSGRLVPSVSLKPDFNPGPVNILYHPQAGYPPPHTHTHTILPQPLRGHYRPGGRVWDWIEDLGFY